MMMQNVDVAIQEHYISGRGGKIDIQPKTHAYSVYTSAQLKHARPPSRRAAPRTRHMPWVNTRSRPTRDRRSTRAELKSTAHDFHTRAVHELPHAAPRAVPERVSGHAV